MMTIMERFIILLFLSASVLAGPVFQKRSAHVESIAIPVAESQVVAAPQQYRNEIPAAAIRNVETVDVRKTITPVVTKTTTHKTHSEPALSVGHVQGYTQTGHGAGKVAEVQYHTHYTQYLNPTVGVNGPVTYSGPAVGQGIAIEQGIAAVPVAPAAYSKPHGLAVSQGLVGSQSHGILAHGHGVNGVSFGVDPSIGYNFGGALLGKHSGTVAIGASGPAILDSSYHHHHGNGIGGEGDFLGPVGVTVLDATSLLGSVGYGGFDQHLHGAF